jgi:hypothetical protein
VRAAIAFVALAACAGGGASKGAASKTAPQPAANQGKPRASSVSCPDGAELAAEMTRVSKLGPRDRFTTAGCREARFGEPGWLVHLWLERGELGDDDYRSELHAVAFTAGWEIVARNAPEPLDAAARAALQPSELQLVDLDGDGMDEIVELVAVVRDGTWFQTLLVGRVYGKRIETIFDRDTGYDNSDTNQRRVMLCRSRLSIDGETGKSRGIVVETEGGPDGCPLEIGTHRFVLRGENIEETRERKRREKPAPKPAEPSRPDVEEAPPPDPDPPASDDEEDDANEDEEVDKEG